MTRRTTALALACVALGAGVLAGCGGGSDTTTSSTIPTVSSTTPLPATTTTREDRGGGKRGGGGNKGSGKSGSGKGGSGSGSSGNSQQAKLAACRKKAKQYREYLGSDIATNRAQAVAKLRKLLAECGPSVR